MITSLCRHDTGKGRPSEQASMRPGKEALVVELSMLPCIEEVV